MKVQKLPAEVRSKLQSGIIVTDAVKCVMELVHNSLDAEATGIAVRIDIKAYRIRVIDNGKGIKKEDLEFVGERFMTSKYHSFVDLETTFPTYGFRGQALSSLQEVSQSLTIETKSEDNGPTLVKVFKNNEALPITEIASNRSGTGTTVTIEDFMYTMPVRRGRISEVFDLEEIKNQLQYLAIIHYNVCFTLRNENKGLILLQTPQASNILESLTNIFGKTLVKSLKPLNYREKKYEITGFISLKPQPQNNIQLLYLNKRVVTKGVIHKFINNMIKEFKGKKTSLLNPTAQEILKSLKNSYNAYIIQIKCPHSHYELFTNLKKTTVEFTNWTDVLKCVHKAVKRTFKNYLNLDSSNTKFNDNKIMAIDDKESKRAFGTSCLVNAVRGAPVKRGLNTKKDIRKRKKVKACENGQISGTSFLKKNENQDLEFNHFGMSSCHSNDVKGILERNKGSKVRSLFESLDSNKIQSDCINDSLESPIPKKKLKHKITTDVKPKSSTFNESFVEFYEWLKKKFDTDPNACNLYQNFLEFKNKTSRLQEVSDFKSPVFGGKLKKKKLQNVKRALPEVTRKKISNDINTLDEEIAIMTQNHLKILPSGHLRVKRAVQFTSEMESEFPESFNFNGIFGENLNFENRENIGVFKKPEDISALSRNQKQIECNQTVLSLSSSDVQFTNIIKFRNLSESFFRQSSFIQKEVSMENGGAPNDLSSWASHYQTFLFNNIDLYDRNQNQRNQVSWMETNRRNKLEEGKNLKNTGLCGVFDSNLSFNKYANKKKRTDAFRDVETQVSVLETVEPVQKVNAIVQTLQAVPESSFENSYSLNESNIVAKNAEVIAQEYQFLEKNLSQEVPNPDFWNTSAHMQFEAECAANINDISAKNPASQLVNEKHSTSSEFICGHKSYLSSNPQCEKSSSKETQTLDAIWTDSLTKLVSPIEGHTKIIPNSKSENMQLPETLPLKEIKDDIHRPNGSGFYLTERHEFIPKGLSPKVLNVETTHVSILSPGEKSKIKLAIDNTQNDLLAKIKWQDESTGDCLKPIIPDGILFEMRQKAGEYAINYENPVLSAMLSYCAIKIQNLLHSFTFTKELFTDLKILGQLDRKFIVTLMKISVPKKMELICLFDQHAVDERIKLEELINENISSDGKFITSCLNSPVECVLTDFNIQVVSDLKEKLFDFGLGFELVNKNTISINMIPRFLLKKHERDLKNKKETHLSDLLNSLIANITDEVRETRGAVSTIPKIIHNAFCLEACHKAIKFNKALTNENMIEMINKLKNCKLPFQCAHGRPSVIPIIDLQDFKPEMEVNDSTGLQNLKSFYNQRKECTEYSDTVL